MPIERAKDSSIAIEVGQRTSSGFRTELPNPGAQTMAGFQQLGDRITAAGTELYAAEQEKTAKSDAYKAPLEIDPATGQYKLPKAPESYGPATAKIFDEISERRTMQMSLQGLQAGLNQDAADHLDDPDAGRAVMQARVEGALKGMDPKIAGQLAPALAAEVNDRHRSLINDTATRTRAANIDGLKQVVATTAVEITDLSSVANSADAEISAAATKKRDGLIAEQAKNMALLERRHALDPLHTQIMEEYIRGLTAAGNMMQVMKERIDAGTLTARDLDAMTRVASGLAGDKENVLGFTPEWIRENLKSPETRAALAANLQKTKVLMQETFAVQASDQRYQAVEAGINAGHRMFNYGMTSEQKEQHILRYSAEKYGNANAVLDPDKAQEIFNRYGELPAKLYTEAFAGMKSRPQEQIKARIELYNRLESMIGQDGRTHNMTTIIAEKDQAFMEHVIAEGGGDKTNPGAIGAAVEVASRVMERAGNTAGGLAGYLKNMSTKTPEAFREALAKALPNDMLIFNQKWDKLSPDQQLTLKNSAANFMTMGLGEDKAMELAAKRFKQIYEKAPAYMLQGDQGGWIRKDQRLPGVNSIDGSEVNTDYMSRSVEALINPNGTVTKTVVDPNDPSAAPSTVTVNEPTPGMVTRPDIKPISSFGKPIPVTAKLEKELFLLQQGAARTVTRMYADGRPVLTDNNEPLQDNGTRYMLMYKHPDGSGYSPVMDGNKPGSPPIILEPGRAQRYNQANILTQKRERQEFTWGQQDDDIKAMETGEPRDPSRGDTFRATGLPAQVDLPPNVNWILPTEQPEGKVGERDVKPVTAGGRGKVMGSGRYDGNPVRPDITYPEGFQPDVPTRGARETSATIGDGSSGFQIPGGAEPKIIQAQAGKIRSLPISDATQAYLMAGATAAGVDVEVVSGGQHAHGIEGVSRKGSTRHDDGHAGDIKLAVMEDGKKRYLNMNNPDDVPRMQAFVREAVKAGATGVGAALDYMGAETIHIGGGKPAVWGKKGGGAPADWIKTAFEEGRSQSSGDSGGAMAMAPVRATFGENAAIATDYFSRRGYDGHVVAGMIGVLFGESTGFDPKARGDLSIPGGSQGIGQWNRTRLNGRDGLLAFAAEHNVRPDNIGTQLAFIEHELQTTEYSTLVRLKAAKTVDQAANAFMGYERPQGYTDRTPEAGKHYVKRLTAARKVHTLIGLKTNG